MDVLSGGDWNKAVGVFSHRRVVLPHWGVNQQQLLSPQQIKDFYNVIHQLDSALAGQNVLVGSEISIADICLGSYFIFAKESQMPLENFANVRRWLSHLHNTCWWQQTAQSLEHILNSSENCPV